MNGLPSLTVINLVTVETMFVEEHVRPEITGELKNVQEKAKTKYCAMLLRVQVRISLG